MNKQPIHLGEKIMMLLLVLIGGVLIYGSQFNKNVGEQTLRLLEKPFFAAILGTILIMTVLLRLLDGLRRPKEIFVDYQSEGGSVGISTRAIQDFVERVGKEFAAVTKIETKLTQQNGSGLDFLILVSIKTGNRIPELTQVLQQRVRENVRESLGLDEIGDITVRVKEIVDDSADEKRPASESSAAL